MSYYEPLTGEEKKVEIRVVCLRYSQKSFVIALEKQKTDDFITVMVKVLGCLGGCMQAIVPNNMKTAIIKSDRYEPLIIKFLTTLLIIMILQLYQLEPCTPKIKP